MTVHEAIDCLQSYAGQDGDEAVRVVKDYIHDIEQDRDSALAYAKDVNEHLALLDSMIRLQGERLAARGKTVRLQADKLNARGYERMKKLHAAGQSGDMEDIVARLTALESRVM